MASNLAILDNRTSGSGLLTRILSLLRNFKDGYNRGWRGNNGKWRGNNSTSSCIRDVKHNNSLLYAS